MEAKEAIMEIEALMEGIRESWTAEDGGLTMAAGDALAFGHGLIESIETGDVDNIFSVDPFSLDTGTEGELLDVALGWAYAQIDE